MLELLDVQTLIVRLELEGCSVGTILLALKVKKQVVDLIALLEKDIPY
jgi:hypothetical protein